jgi:ABC-2 type transport system ATP-binding protein
MLRVENVRKTYGGRPVLTDVSFDIADRRITGFVGANGAGKTTTMRIMLGVLNADSGRVMMDDRVLTPDDRRIFGYMPEERGLYPKMRLAEQIVYFGRLHGMTRAAAESSTAGLLERLEIAARSNDEVGSLSLGNQQRAQIAAALVHEPEVLILDEPFSGLDPLGVDTVLDVLRDAALKGAPVLFSSHQLDLVERLCDDLIIIADGAIRANGTPESLRAEHSHSSYDILLEGDAGWLRDVDGITVTELDGSHAVFAADDPAAAQRVLSRAVTLGGVREFAPLRRPLAQIFKEIVR